MFFQNLYLFIILILLCFFITSTSSHRECYFLVKIEETNSTSVKCAGTILTNNTVLTSAHCLQNKTESSITVRRIYSSQTCKHPIDRIAIHPLFNNSTLENDIAVVKIKGTFKIRVAKIRLSNSSIIDPLNYYTDCSVISWFARDHQILKSKLTKVNVKLIPKDECVKRFADSRGNVRGREKICGYYNHNIGDCFFGTGGPVLCYSRSFRDSKAAKWLSNDELENGAREVEKSKYVGKNDTLGNPLDLMFSISSNGSRVAGKSRFVWTNGTVGNDTSRRKSEFVVKNDTLDKPLDFMFSIPENRRKRRVDRLQYIQVGIVSWEHGCSSLPSILTRVDVYHNWIKKTVKELCNCEDEIISDVYSPFRKPSKFSQSFRFQFSACLIYLNVFCSFLVW